MMHLPMRPMTPEEQRGFAIACGVFGTFGRQLAETVSLPGQQDAAREMRKHGKFLCNVASAFDLQFGGGTGRLDAITPATLQG